MSGPDVTARWAVVAATGDRIPAARLTVRSALLAGNLPCLVVDVDGAYRPVAGERVLTLSDAVRTEALRVEASTAAATLEPDEFAAYCSALGACAALGDGADGVLVLGAGILVVDDLRPLPADAAVVPHADPGIVPSRADWQQARVVLDRSSGLLTVEGSGPGPVFSRAFYSVRTSAQAALLRVHAADWRVAGRALDLFAATADVTVLRDPSLLATAWRAIGETAAGDDGRVHVQGSPLRAIDLTSFDPRSAWIIDAHADGTPRLLLSEQPALAEMVHSAAGTLLADEVRAPVPSWARLDRALRSEARRAQDAGADLPDLVGLGGPDLTEWALGLVPEDAPRPVARYLAAVRHGRADLQQAFREVPGPDATGLARWAQKSGVHEPFYDGALLARAATATLLAQPPGMPGRRQLGRGVNLVGYLAGELGLGESARLVDSALQAAGVPTSTHDVSRDLASRRRADYRRSEPTIYRTSLICLNGAETAAVAPALRSLLKRTRVVGMWYWELEDLPESYRAGFQFVDEIWTATDFMREAIAKHAGDVPVRTVTPPLPQAGDDPGVVPQEFDIPSDRPWFLFTFDFLSMALRKNPYGLVEAFTRAFAHLSPGERPALVIKTINADRAPSDAERLRVQIAGRTDIRFIDAYLDNEQRHVLVSNCTAYVSLHKAEGLGLTVAEAMAWGRPVITTAYGGVMQFCTSDNSLLVDWRRGQVEQTSGPYAEGMAWAEPDLDHAARLMRQVVEEPARAAAVGMRAAEDIRVLHNARVAGRAMRDSLDEGDELWETMRTEARDDQRRSRAGESPTSSAARRFLGARWRGATRS